MVDRERQIDRRTKRRIMVRFGKDAPSSTAFTMNLSRSGAFIRTNSVLRPGTMMRVHLSLDDHPFDVLAQVIWAKKVPAQLAHVVTCGMGVRFVDAGPDWEASFKRWQESK